MLSAAKANNNYVGRFGRFNCSFKPLLPLGKAVPPHLSRCSKLSIKSITFILKLLGRNLFEYVNILTSQSAGDLLVATNRLNRLRSRRSCVNAESFDFASCYFRRLCASGSDIRTKRMSEQHYRLYIVRLPKLVYHELREVKQRHSR